MAGADLAAEITTVSMGRQEPEDVGFLGGRWQIELVSHSVVFHSAASSAGCRLARLRYRAPTWAFGRRGSSAKKLLAQCSRRVVVFVSTPLLQFRDKVRHNVAERLVGHRIGEIEAVNVGVLNPFLEQIRGGLRAAHEQRPETSDADPFGQLAHSPDLLGSALENASTDD